MTLDYSSIRTIEDDIILSPSLPRLGVRISPNFIYVGDLQYIARDKQHVEEFIFLNPNGLGHVTQLLLVHFEGFLDNKPGMYDYHPRQSIQLDGSEYLYDLEFITIQDYIAHYPSSDLAHAADYIRQRAYTLAGEMTFQRFLRQVSPDRRNEFVVAYLERDEDPILTPEDLQADPAIGQALMDRALSSFTIVH